MSRISPPLATSRQRARVRALSALGALFVSGGLVAALLGAFHQAATPRWLLPTPELMELVSQCETAATRGQRESCVKQVVAERLEPEPSVIRLVRRDTNMAR